MAGRGRGRGRGGSLSINIEALGLGRGDIMTPIVAHPPPLYPPQLFKPVQLSNNEELDYMLALKQELRDNFRASPFHVNAPTKVKDIERYSDKYQIGIGATEVKLVADWSRLPHELQEKRRKKRGVKGKLKPNLKSALHNKDVESLLHKFEDETPNTDAAEDGDAHDDDEEEKERKNREDIGDDEGEEEEYDEEDLEEETDYNQAYFDNGEAYADEDDDDDEGPTY